MYMSDKEKYAAFEELFVRWFQRLYVHAYGFVEDEECAKDIVHDAYAYLWENFDRFETDHLPALLYKLTHHYCIDYLRHEKAALHYVEEQSALPETDMYEYIDYKEYDSRIVRIKKAIQELPPQTRRVFIACVLHKNSYKEAAERFGISPLTVKTLVTRALKSLRKQSEFFSPIVVLLLSSFYAF